MLDISYKEVIQHATFYVWLSSLSKTLTRLIHVCRNLFFIDCTTSVCLFTCWWTEDAPVSSCYEGCSCKCSQEILLWRCISDSLSQIPRRRGAWSCNSRFHILRSIWTVYNTLCFVVVSRLVFPFTMKSSMWYLNVNSHSNSCQGAMCDRTTLLQPIPHYWTPCITSTFPILWLTALCQLLAAVASAKDNGWDRQQGARELSWDVVTAWEGTVPDPRSQ